MYRIAWKSKSNPSCSGHGEYCLSLNLANSWIDYYKPSNQCKHSKFNTYSDDLIHWIESSDMPGSYYSQATSIGDTGDQDYQGYHRSIGQSRSIGHTGDQGSIGPSGSTGHTGAPRYGYYTSDVQDRKGCW
jgi:hypothetical protein